MSGALERVYRVIDTAGREYPASTVQAKEPMYRLLDGYACTLEYANPGGLAGWGTARTWDRDERTAVVRAALDARIAIAQVLDPREKSTAEQLLAAADVAAARARLDLDALTIERRPEQVIATVRDGDRTWTADGRDLAECLASIVREMQRDGAR